MVFHSGHQRWHACAPVVAGAASMDITEDTRKRVGTGTRGRQQEPGQAWVGGQPRLDGLCRVDLIVIHPHVYSWVVRSWIVGFQVPEPVVEQRVGLAWPATVA